MYFNTKNILKNNNKYIFKQANNHNHTKKKNKKKRKDNRGYLSFIEIKFTLNPILNKSC